MRTSRRIDELEAKIVELKDELELTRSMLVKIGVLNGRDWIGLHREAGQLAGYSLIAASDTCNQLHALIRHLGLEVKREPKVPAHWEYVETA